MKFLSFVLLFITSTCFCQNWQGEVMVGVAGYSGDLTKNYISLRTIGPAISANLKYPVFQNLVLIRGGLAYGKISGNDRYNKLPPYTNRNLNFKSHILEFSLCAEVNLFDPKHFDGYPYLFGGVGVFHFNPYTFNKDDKKTYLWPLGTEGQGLAAYPEKKMYALSQICLPIGGGWKHRWNDQVDIIFELGGRLLFTDHLDDVSTTYADPQVLLAARGTQAAELAYRYPIASANIAGGKRGNPKANDWYFMSGFKLLYKFNSLNGD